MQFIFSRNIIFVILFSSHSDRLFEAKKIIHIKLIICQHKLHPREQIKGLFMVRIAWLSRAFVAFIDKNETKSYARILHNPCFPQIPYTPHANAFELNAIFEMLKPQRVYPLIQRSYPDDQMSAIIE